MTLAATVGNGEYRLGMSGPIVTAIQLALRDRGYALKGTGYFGNATDVAVETAQRRGGFTGKAIDGVVGRDTAKMIDATPLAKTIAPASLVEVGRPLWLEAGIKLIGTKEFSGSKDNPAIIDWAKEEGGDIAKSYTHDSIPWCALFANHLLTKVGLKGTETLWALDFDGHWPAIKLPGPAVGAFAPMIRDGGGHIMVVVGKDSNGIIQGLGGNQSDAVNIASFAMSRLNRGFWWPKGVNPPTTTGIAHLPVVSKSGKVSSRES